ncbi:MAG: hypothetical protein KIS92_07350 [Planctomycetota bacterium]|nr:hypothetical protein [Planctomycetota bacterium]
MATATAEPPKDAAPVTAASLTKIDKAAILLMSMGRSGRADFSATWTSPRSRS